MFVFTDRIFLNNFIYYHHRPYSIKSFALGNVYLLLRLNGSISRKIAQEIGEIIEEYRAHIVSPGRHSLKNESEYNRGYSYANKWAAYSAI